MSISAQRLAAYYDASYPPDILNGGGGDGTKLVKPGDFFPADAAITASDAANAAKLIGLGYVVDPATLPWAGNDKFVIEQPAFPGDPVYGYSFHWSTPENNPLLPSDVWKPSPAPGLPGPKGYARAGDNFVPEPTITASDATNAAKLTALGYVPSDPFGWGYPGAKMTVGGFNFYYDQAGSAWAAGAHA